MNSISLLLAKNVDGRGQKGILLDPRQIDQNE